MASLPLSERASLMAELLTARGYMAEAVQVSPDGTTRELDSDTQDAIDVVTRLRLHNCSMREIAEMFPEACAAEAAFVERMLGVPVVREGHQLRGCRTCEYSVCATRSFPTLSSAQEAESTITIP